MSRDYRHGIGAPRATVYAAAASEAQNAKSPPRECRHTHQDRVLPAPRLPQRLGNVPHPRVQMRDHPAGDAAARVGEGGGAVGVEGRPLRVVLDRRLRAAPAEAFRQRCGFVKAERKCRLQIVNSARGEPKPGTHVLHPELQVQIQRRPSPLLRLRPPNHRLRAGRDQVRDVCAGHV